MPNVVGIDVGLVLHKATSGLCRSGDDGFKATHSYLDKLSRQTALQFPSRVDVLAIDGPVLPAGQLNYDRRPAEKVFVWDPFRLRCGVGETAANRPAASGVSAGLRRGGCDTAQQFGGLTANSSCKTEYPKIQRGLAVIEAFPNAFMGVMLPESAYPNPMPTLGRGNKFEWLLTNWRDRQLDSKLNQLLAWSDSQLWAAVEHNSHHEEQAALICALTAICVLQNQYTAVGEPVGGYLFLPPWQMWANWAKDGIRKNRTDRRLAQVCGRQVNVWIDGKRYTPDQALPA